MTDYTYCDTSIHYQLWRWIIPVIVGGTVVAGLWAGHHQPEPVSCEPGSSAYVDLTKVVSSTIADFCWHPPR